VYFEEVEKILDDYVEKYRAKGVIE
jgi:hypothetical protein